MLRSQSGNTWYELLGAEPGHDPHETIIRCLEHPELLTDWEIQFLHCLRGFSAPSRRQQAVVDGIWAKVKAAR